MFCLLDFSVNVRMSVLEKYLHWRLLVTSEDFQKYCRNYLPLKHKPMSDIKEALNLAQDEIKFDVQTIRRNGFIISTDPIKTKMILENVDNIAGLDIREAIRLEPGLLKNNYRALLEVKSLMEVSTTCILNIILLFYVCYSIMSKLLNGHRWVRR